MAKRLPLYRLDWGVWDRQYRIRFGVPIWIEEMVFVNGEWNFKENYQRIAYEKYKELRKNGQIVDEWKPDGTFTRLKNISAPKKRKLPN